MMMAFKGVFASLAGPAPNYDMQKILSTRSPEEASKMSGFVSIILLPIRYALIIGLTILGLLYYHQMNLKAPDGSIDFERILPLTINNFPACVGLVGLVLTGLLGAFMGTFSGTVNAAQAYIVNDIYLKYVNPQRQHQPHHFDELRGGRGGGGRGGAAGLSGQGREYGAAVHRVGALRRLHRVQRAQVALVALQCHGFFRGHDHGHRGGGRFSACLFKAGNLLYWFPVLFGISLAGSIMGTYLAPPTDTAVLQSLLQNGAALGLSWGPVLAAVRRRNPGFSAQPQLRAQMPSTSCWALSRSSASPFCPCICC